MSSFALVQNRDRRIENPARIRICDSFDCRLRGLMFRRGLGREEGLLLMGARDSRLDSAIHMLFVPFDLAVFWIAESKQVVDKVIAKAWRAAYIPARPARYVLEIHPVRFTNYEVGHTIEIIHV